MKTPSYANPPGGLPPQSQLLSGRAIFTDAYAFIPKGVMTDIVTSALPHWKGERAWVLARPLSGFAETFSQMVVELSPGGGSDRPETDPEAESVLFVTEGSLTLVIDGKPATLVPGAYAYLPPGCNWTIRNHAGPVASFHWIRKRYERVEGIDVPARTLHRPRQRPRPGRHGRYRRRLGDDAFRRSGRHAPRHACQHRHPAARRPDPVP